jgi:hypothetical protein
MNIQPTYVTFEQAKLIKEKGFDYYKIFQDITDYYDYYDKNVQGRCHVSDFSEDKYPDDKWIPVPEHWEVVEWLRVNHDIHIDLAAYYNPQRLDKLFYEAGISTKENGYEGLLMNNIHRINTNWTKEPSKYWLFNSPQEAYSTAFDYILKELI